MKRCAVGLALFGTLAAAACSAEDGGESATGGSAGSGGSGADAGSSGSAGDAGTGGTGASSGMGGTGGSAGTGGSGGTGGGSGSGGTGGGCNDPGPEPNDTLPQATPTCDTPPCEIGDCDGNGDSVSGVAGPGDVDFFAFKGNDNVGCQVNATATTADSGFRLCVFVQCEGGATTELDSCTSGTLTDGPNGYKGCCTTAPGSAEAAHNCSGLDESAGVYIRIDEATACTPYVVDFHY